MISVAEALDAILSDLAPLPAEDCLIAEADGRILAQDVTANRTQPPFAASAMDGYAVRFADLAVGKTLKLIGESAAGHGFNHPVASGQCVRIFTGAPMPEGADTLLIQEDTQRDGDDVTITALPDFKGHYVRPAGLDFHHGDIGAKAGEKLKPEVVALLAGMDHTHLPVRRRPKIGLLSLGDELCLPGEERGPDDIIATNAFGIAALARRCGADVIDFGLIADSEAATTQGLTAAMDARCDIILTLGGASVGDHDFAHKALTELGVPLAFWKIAMRPGKPMMYGRKDATSCLGLPGNPVSAIVCAHLFLRPILGKLLASPAPLPQRRRAQTLTELPANDRREDHLRAVMTEGEDGLWQVRAFEKQDSSMLRVLAQSNCLIIRPPPCRGFAGGRMGGCD